MTKTKKAFAALFLCICLLMTGSVRPFFAFAALDEELDGFDESDMVDESDVIDEFVEVDESDEVEDKYKDKIDDLSSKLEKLASERKKIEQSINATQSEKEKAQRAKAALDAEMNITQGEIGLLYERIEVLEQKIADKLDRIASKQNDIKKKQDEVDKNFEILRKRLRAMYMQDTTTTLGLLVGSDSFSDLLTRTEYIRRIAGHDRELMQTLTDQRIVMEGEKLSLEKEKAELEDGKKAIEADRAETEVKKAQLATEVSKAELQIQDIVEMERAYKADLEKNKQIQDAAKAELDRIYREIEWSKNAYIGGAMAWPLPGFSTISSNYGLRFGGADNHTGIDITGSGVFGHNIVAANDGVVVVANLSYAQGVGYGKYVAIDHGVDENGNSISTIYGHCSSLSVSVGQSVRKGQTIAQVGSTGWSTGPHLHFEVRFNGKHVNPSPFIYS